MSPVLLLGIVISLGIVAFVMFGIPALRKLGGQAGGLFFPGDDGPARPQYSLAEARKRAGDYEAALVEYRKVIEQHPTDVYAHMQIAQLAVAHFDDLATAEVELLNACRKAGAPETIALAYSGLADLYQFQLQNPTRALEVEQELCRKLPGTKIAERATERIAALQAILGGAAIVKPPTKIAFRKRPESPPDARA